MDLSATRVHPIEGDSDLETVQTIQEAFSRFYAIPGYVLSCQNPTSGELLNPTNVCDVSFEDGMGILSREDRERLWEGLQENYDTVYRSLDGTLQSQFEYETLLHLWKKCVDATFQQCSHRGELCLITQKTLPFLATQLRVIVRLFFGGCVTTRDNVTRITRKG
jgi:hypothetical protein